MTFQFDDGGRAAAGYKGHTGDCVCRAIAIASGRPYSEIYERLAEGNATQRRSKGQAVGKYNNSGQRTADRGIFVRRKWFRDYMAELGFKWIPTMFIGKGCQVHLHDGELPGNARLVVAVSKHYTAVIDDVIRDTHDPRRETVRTGPYDGVPRPNLWLGEDERTAHWVERRCVYGYWILSTDVVKFVS